jgi:two-component system, OmpR family, sensor histidine kinase ChvG
VALSIRNKLLLVSLVLLSIPLVGYGFVREMEKVLRSGQEQAVAATARAVATALHDRPNLLQRRAAAQPSDAPSRAAGNEIETIIKGLQRSSARIWVIDRNRDLLALEGSLQGGEKKYEQGGGILRPLYSLILKPPAEDFDDALPEDAITGGREVYSALSGIPAQRWRKSGDERVVILSAAHPIWNGDEVIGAVVAEETTNAVVSLTNRALEQLIAVTLAVFIFGAGTLILFASSISRRLSRLRNEAEQAIDAQGRVAQHFRATKDGDEIGDLSRSFGAVLDRLGEYNAYLERMADRLSHELRTPVAVVSSSLENLKSESSPDARVYIERAEEGVKRLNLILTRIAEASRLEQILRNAEREPFDLGRVVSGCVAGYTGAFQQHRFELKLPERRIELMGSPDLIAQALDKLVDNARDFSAPGEPILIELDRDETQARLSVSNSGPLLPETMQKQLFESMVSLRSGASKAAAPHLGLGLFIVRLIAEFHQGQAAARNREDGSGAIFSIVLPVD